MNCGAYREKIIIQHKDVSTDEIGQQSERWEDYLICRAYVNNLSGKEFWEAAQQNAERTVVFVTRYCSKLSKINTTDYRIVFRENIYDIIFVDNVQYKNNTLKLKALVKDSEQ